MPLHRSVPAAHLAVAVLASSGGAAGQLTNLAEAGAAVTWAIVAAVVLLTAGVVLLLARHRMRTDATEERLRRERLHRDERSGGEGHGGEAYHGEGRDGEEHDGEGHDGEGHDGEAPGP